MMKVTASFKSLWRGLDDVTLVQLRYEYSEWKRSRELRLILVLLNLAVICCLDCKKRRKGAYST